MDEKTQALIKSVEKLIPELNRKIEDALPSELRPMFRDLYFLSLFHATLPPTETGVLTVQRLIDKYKDLIPS